MRDVQNQLFVYFVVDVYFEEAKCKCQPKEQGSCSVCCANLNLTFCRDLKNCVVLILAYHLSQWIDLACNSSEVFVGVLFVCLGFFCIVLFFQ